MALSTLLTLVLSLFIAPSLQQSQQCYHRNGEPVANGSLGPALPCPGVDSCCLQGDVCYTGGMCFNSVNGAAYQGFCTAKNWTTGQSCPQECTSFYSDTFMWINPCGGKQSCCAGPDNSLDCCDSPNADDFIWNFSLIGAAGSNSSAPSPTTGPGGLVSGTTTIVATVTSVNTIVSFGGTRPAAASVSVSVSVSTVTVNSGANDGRCEGVCGLIRNMATFVMLWL